MKAFAYCQMKDILETQDFTKAESTAFQNKMVKTLHIIKNDKITTISEDTATLNKNSAVSHTAPATRDFTKSIAFLPVVALSGCCLMLNGWVIKEA